MAAKQSLVTINGISPRKAPAQYTASQTPVAVLGFAFRLPGKCSTPHALWDFLLRGSIAKNDPPKSQYRFNFPGHYDGSGKPGTMVNPGGMFLEEIDLAAFDASFFNISPIDAASMDPQQRLLLEVIYECLENCGTTLDQIRGRDIGCIVASNSAGALLMVSCEVLLVLTC